MFSFRSLFGTDGLPSRANAARAVPVALAILFLAVMAVTTVFPGMTVSKALAELVARSPGMRIGGTALKAKTRHAQVLPGEQNPAEAPPRKALASVLGNSFGPESMDGLPQPDEDFPDDFTNNTVPTEGTNLVGGGGGSPSGGGGFIGGGAPPVGGGLIGNPPPGPGPSPTPTGDLGPVVPVPEPASWALMMVGFGVIGHRIRSRKLRSKIA